MCGVNHLNPVPYEKENKLKTNKHFQIMKKSVKDAFNKKQLAKLNNDQLKSIFGKGSNSSSVTTYTVTATPPASPSQPK